ncbi:hypothetical protein IFT67_16955 [Sphingomonas sp. CFBP 13728]|uniref:hypothetical protein n=1 Tax=Sphingomonas sp. CFBP 13728 TaxID=2775294 RepID=UPI0017804844|nr:hypothetical protein [Sphingomonas sp. CFBP 13728]MBD8620613.1 hypothetical protein [Sphingomonas sp. CFBP 13728]
MSLTIDRGLRLIRGNIETLFAIANFGASSIFWLALAFLIPAARYGQMMTLQAAVFLIVTALTFRTHDLVFFLVRNRGQGIDQAFRIGFAIEAVAAVVATLVCAAVAATVWPMPGATPTGAALLALVAGIGGAQGAAVAKLRYLVRGRSVMLADAACMVGWIAAGLTALALRNASLLTLLTVGTVPNALRTVALLAGVRRHRGVLDSAPLASGWADRGAIIRFLGGAQLTNFLKNGSVSIETMILAAFCPPTAVAMYRLAKSTQGAASAAINVEYQRSYSALARADTHMARLAAVQHLRRKSIRLCVALYPVSATFALAYALHKPDIGLVTFQFVTLAAFVAFIPAAAQQGYMILLLQEGAHRTVNAAYILSVGLLCTLSLTLLAVPTISIFLTALIASAVARVWFLSVKAAPLLS